MRPATSPTTIWTDWEKNEGFPRAACPCCLDGPACCAAETSALWHAGAKKPMAGAIEFRDVSYRLPSGRLLLESVSIALEPGSTTALLGRSGSGKTTLLRTVNGMHPVSSGQVLVRGNDVAAHDLIALRRSIGYVIQETGLFPHFTVERNIGLVLEVEGRPKAEIAARARALMDMVGLPAEHFAHRLPHELSGGQRQRVGLGRALAAGQDILLLDEPFGALDPLTRAEMQDLLRALCGRMHTTILLVTHDLDEALYLAQRIVLLENGQVAADLPAVEFLASPNPAVAAYVRAVHRGAQSAEVAP
jgi:osmoprotectant transport system ATP-binding protein